MEEGLFHKAMCLLAEIFFTWSLTRRHPPSVFEPNITNPRCLQDHSKTAVVSLHQLQIAECDWPVCSKQDIWKMHQEIFSSISLSELSRIKTNMIFIDVMGLALHVKKGGPQEMSYFQLKV